MSQDSSQQTYHIGFDGVSGFNQGLKQVCNEDKLIVCHISGCRWMAVEIDIHAPEAQQLIHMKVFSICAVLVDLIGFVIRSCVVHNC